MLSLKKFINLLKSFISTKRTIDSFFVMALNFVCIFGIIFINAKIKLFTFSLSTFFCILLPYVWLIFSVINIFVTKHFNLKNYLGNFFVNDKKRLAFLTTCFILTTFLEITFTGKRDIFRFDYWKGWITVVTILISLILFINARVSKFTTIFCGSLCCLCNCLFICSYIFGYGRTTLGTAQYLSFNFENTNAAGLAILFVTIGSLVLSFSTKKTYIKIPPFLLLPFDLFLLFKTGARSSFVAFFILVICFFLFLITK